MPAGLTRRALVKRASSHVGRHWGANGDVLTLRMGMAPNNPSQGGPAHIGAEDNDNLHGPVSTFPSPLCSRAAPAAMFALAMGVAPPLGRFAYDGSSDRVRLSWPASDPAITG